MIIWGFRARNKVMGQIQYVCPNCHQNSFHTVVRSSRWFTLFFIPTFPFSKKYISHCNVCGFESRVENNQAEAWFPQGPVQALPPQQPAPMSPDQYQPQQYEQYQQPAQYPPYQQPSQYPPYQQPQQYQQPHE